MKGTRDLVQTREKTVLHVIAISSNMMTSLARDSVTEFATKLDSVPMRTRIWSWNLKVF